jgi:hypothetical protein
MKGKEELTDHCWVVFRFYEEPVVMVPHINELTIWFFVQFLNLK